MSLMDEENAMRGKRSEVSDELLVIRMLRGCGSQEKLIMASKVPFPEGGATCSITEEHKNMATFSPSLWSIPQACIAETVFLLNKVAKLLTNQAMQSID